MTLALTVQQCAKQISVVPHSIRKWIWAGKLPAKKLRKGREQWTYLVNVEDWQQFMEERSKGRLPDRRNVEAMRNSTPHPPQPLQHYAYFPTDDPEDRLIQQATLMRQAMKGCKASRDALRSEPFRLTYWMAVDGVEERS